NILGPDDSDARGFAEEAREIFVRLRARPFIEQLEHADKQDAVTLPSPQPVESSPRL
ncbi:MAG: hypothetical protein H0W00_05140, partial [Chloroflexi bacterium]|nr:hypothetical protein [Chloroflexota bacterium]